MSVRVWKVPVSIWLLAEDPESARLQAANVISGDGMLITGFGTPEPAGDEHTGVMRQLRDAFRLMADLTPEEADEMFLHGMHGVSFTPEAAAALERLRREREGEGSGGR